MEACLGFGESQVVYGLRELAGRRVPLPSPPSRMPALTATLSANVPFLKGNGILRGRLRRS
jgi:hypothetical protein